MSGNYNYVRHDPCACGCGREQGKGPRMNLRRACYDRWRALGRPDLPLPPPRTRAELAALARQAKAGKEADRRAGSEPYIADAYDIEHARAARARRETEPDTRIFRAGPFAADLARAVQCGDKYGVRLLFARMKDVPAVLVALAACADIDLLMTPDGGEREAS